LNIKLKLKRGIIFIGIIFILVIVYIIYQRFFKQPPPSLFKTELSKKRNISHKVIASGILEIKNLIKIGSIVSGITKEVYVKENQFVKKGQILAEIDPGTKDTDFQITNQENIRAQENYNYKKNNFKRQKKLFEAGQLSKDFFEKLIKNFKVAEQDLHISKSKLEREKLLLDARKIIALEQGFISYVKITKGSGVSGSSVAGSTESIFEIAPDISKMEAKLDIDESDVGVIKADQKVEFTVNTYQDIVMDSKIKEVDFSPKTKGDTSFYKAAMDIDNKEKLFRPGMALNAKINIAYAENVFAIKGIIFQINPKSIKAVAKQLNYLYQPLEKQAKKKFKEENSKQRVKFIWIAQEKSFIEKPIILGITDNNYFEVKSGLADSDQVIIDVVEEDEMQKLYKKAFAGSL
jgi:HlyD family secretion protein